MIINNKRIYCNNGWSISNYIACSPHDQGKQKQYNADHAFKQDYQNSKFVKLQGNLNIGIKKYGNIGKSEIMQQEKQV